MFAGNVVTREFAKSKLVGVVSDFFKTKLASERFEISVVGMRERRGQIHPAAAAESNFGFLRNQAFAQCRESDGKFDGGAGLSAAGKSQLLVHHGQDASAGGFNGDDRAVHVAQRVYGSLTYHGIFAGRNVTGSQCLRRTNSYEKRS